MNVKMNALSVGMINYFALSTIAVKPFCIISDQCEIMMFDQLSALNHSASSVINMKSFCIINDHSNIQHDQSNITQSKTPPTPSYDMVKTINIAFLLIEEITNSRQLMH